MTLHILNFANLLVFPDSYLLAIPELLIQQSAIISLESMEGGGTLIIDVWFMQHSGFLIEKDHVTFIQHKCKKIESDI